MQAGMRQREHLVGDSLPHYLVRTVLRVIENPFLKRLEITHTGGHFDLGQCATQITRINERSDFRCPRARTCHGVFSGFLHRGEFSL